VLFDTDAIQSFVNAPPGQVVAGSILAGIVWKFFEKIENVLSDETKFEIAVWLVGVEAERKVYSWPATFSKLFYKAFGRKTLSWKAASRSAVATVCTLVVMNVFNELWGVWGERPSSAREILFAFPIQLAVNLGPDFLSVASTRYFLEQLQARTSASRTGGLLASNVLVAVCIAVVCMSIMIQIQDSCVFTNYYYKAVFGITHDEKCQNHLLDQPELAFELHVGLVVLMPTLLASLFTSIWVWLYAAGGFLIKAARHFDVGFAFLVGKSILRRSHFLPSAS
jgi:hypothetical protein